MIATLGDHRGSWASPIENYVVRMYIHSPECADSDLPTGREEARRISSGQRAYAGERGLLFAQRHDAMKARYGPAYGAVERRGGSKLLASLDFA